MDDTICYQHLKELEFRLEKVPLFNAQIHILNGTLVNALAIFQIVQNVHHFIVDLINFARYIAADAGFVD